MRVFVAVALPASSSEAAASASRQLRDAIARQAPRARLTWVTPDRMHVTLRFLGDMDASAAAAVTGVLERPCQTAPFTLTVGSPGVFPSRGAPRTCWLSIATGLDSLRALEGEISSRLDGLGIRREPRLFTPHVTLARIRDAAGLRSDSWLRVSVPADAGGVVDAITLFESRLSPDGPTYTALQRTPLSRG